VTPRLGTRVEVTTAGAVRRALDEETGDILVFLPGAREIRGVAGMLDGVDAEIVQLHGNLPPQLQDRALRPNSRGARRVVLATSIAETSLTIEGVRVVIDAGLARVPRYSPRTGMTRLATVRVSRASADQRRGRAGRLGPGVCYRLWSPHQDRDLPPSAPPEILEADLASLALDLAAAGVADPAELAWLDPPPAASYSEACSLLIHLGALTATGRITAHGGAMARLAMHPRLAHMVLKGREMAAGETACEVAALLTERDVLSRHDSVPDADIRIRLDVLRGVTVRDDVNQQALRGARAVARACRGGPGRTEQVGLLLAFAYPDRIARQRPGQPGKYLLRNGVGAALQPGSLAREEFIVAAELEGGASESRILLAAPLSLGEIEEHFGDAVEREELVEWDEAARAVTARRRERLGAVVLREAALARPDAERVLEVLLDALGREKLAGLKWSETATGLRERVGFLRRLDPTWPDLSDGALAASVREWLGPHLGGIRRIADVERLDLHRILLEVVGWTRRDDLDRLAPTHIQVPSGSRVPVNYSSPEAPKLAVRLQEVFGMRETPRVAGGQVALTLHLLSPASRPVQVTRDLAGFWRTTYFDVRKDLKGRYPRHYWPDDPLRAEATRRAKPRGKGNQG
jgi:ATP-dependent helicase HrpB